MGSLAKNAWAWNYMATLLRGFGRQKTNSIVELTWAFHLMLGKVGMTVGNGKVYHHNSRGCVCRVSQDFVHQR